MPPRAQPVRRTQAERRATTRGKLLDAVLSCLVEKGYASLTTPDVCRAAGVSQGALFKHFPTKAALLAAATEHLFAALRQGYAERFAAPAVVADPIGKGVQLLSDVFQDPRLHAAYDLYTAARTDPELRASLAPVVRRHSEDLHGLARALLGNLVSADDRLDDAVDLAMLALQGLVLNEMAHHQPGSRERALAVLTELASALLRGTGGKDGKERKRR